MTDPKKWGGRCDSTDAPQTLHQNHHQSTSASTAAEDFDLVISKAEARADSRELARRLRNQHQAVMKLIERYLEALQRFGKVVFQKAPSTDSRTGQRERYALLNEDQAFLLLTMSRNTDHVVDLKAQLVAAFGAARRAAQQHGAEYLPGYHTLHDEIAAKAAGSSHEKFVHMNINRLINKACGLDAGQRGAVALPQQSMLVVCQALATNALRSAPDHHVGYERAKRAVESLSQTMLEVR
jgi:phage regulator Rha-like protein